MFWDDEISMWWCLGDTWRCTPSEAAGLWAVIIFYATVFFVTLCHLFIQSRNGTSVCDVEATQQHTTQNAGDDCGTVCLLVVYFFSLVVGSLLWVAAGVRWVHPVQIWQLQILGVAILVTCAVLFVAVEQVDHFRRVRHRSSAL